PERLPVPTSTLADRLDDLVIRPPPDAGVGVRRDVRRDPRPEVFVELEPSREMLVGEVTLRALRRVAVAARAEHLDQIAPAFNRALRRGGQRHPGNDTQTHETNHCTHLLLLDVGGSARWGQPWGP